MHYNSYVTCWMGDQGLVIGKVVRSHCSPTTKSAYPILQWKKDDPRSNVVACCVNVSPIDVKSDTWSLQLKNRFIFCPMKALLIQIYIIDREEGLEANTNDIAKIRCMLPQLHGAEKKRKEEQVTEMEASLRKRKEGPPEEMSVLLSLVPNLNQSQFASKGHWIDLVQSADFPFLYPSVWKSHWRGEVSGTSKPHLFSRIPSEKPSENGSIKA